MMRSPYLLRFFSKFHLFFGGVLLVPLLVDLFSETSGESNSISVERSLLGWLLPAVVQPGF